MQLIPVLAQLAVAGSAAAAHEASGEAEANLKKTKQNKLKVQLKIES